MTGGLTRAPAARDTAVVDETERVRRLYDREAPRYDRATAAFERLFLGDGRAWLCSPVRGEALEVAIGTGRNLPYYGPDARLTGVELSPAMLDLARRRARELGRRADLREGDAAALPFEDGAFDAVVIALALCTIPDDHRAVREAHRVLRPGGELRLLEHVRSPSSPVRLVQRTLEPYTLATARDHLVREPLEAVRAAGFEVESLERSRLGVIERLTARKRGG